MGTFRCSMQMFRSVARSLTILLVSASAISACTCVSRGVKYDLAEAAVVFRGTVKSVVEQPPRPEWHRSRYAVNFSVVEYWKGSPGDAVVLHVIEPGTDCIGARFDLGVEYVVFARLQEADDNYLAKNFWYGWLDLLPRGTRILSVNSFCDSTGEARTSIRVLRALGKGQKPR